MPKVDDILTAQEKFDNDEKKLKLFDLLSSGEGILMAGAGITATMYPTWNELIDQMYQQARKVNKKFKRRREKDDFLLYCDHIKSCIGADLYYDFILKCYQPKSNEPYRDYHKSLAGLLMSGKLKAITTTNYDVVLDNALASYTKQANNAVYITPGFSPAVVYDFLRSLNTKGTINRIFHFHGVYYVENSIILSRSEYEHYYGFNLESPGSSLYESLSKGALTEENLAQILNAHGMNWPLHRKILWSFLATRRMIFMGFSLNDPFFIRMLDHVGKDLHTFGYDNHFLIARVTNIPNKLLWLKRAEVLKSKYGIETILFLENEEGTGLEDFILEMEAIAPEASSLSEDQNGMEKLPITTAGKGSKERNELLIKLSQNRHGNHQ